jgi:hypothetical protein
MPHSIHIVVSKVYKRIYLRSYAQDSITKLHKNKHRASSKYYKVNLDLKDSAGYDQLKTTIVSSNSNLLVTRTVRAKKIKPPTRFSKHSRYIYVQPKELTHHAITRKDKIYFLLADKDAQAYCTVSKVYRNMATTRH